MPKLRRALVLALMLCSPLTLTGCWLLAAGAVAGIAAYTYQTNQLETTQARSVAEVHQAALAGLNDLDLRIITESHDKLSGSIRATNSRNQTIQIDESRVADNSTKVTIRVGTGLTQNERDQATTIYDAMANHL